MFGVIDKINLEVRRNELRRIEKVKHTNTILEHYRKCMTRVKEANDTPIVCRVTSLDVATAVKERIDKCEPLLHAHVIGIRTIHPSICITLKDDMDRS